MKNFKNIISLVITVAMLATMFALPMSASAADTPLFFDDMESHDLAASITGTADTTTPLIDGVWATSPVFGGTNGINNYCVRYDLLFGNIYNSNDGATTNKTIAIKPGNSNKDDYLSTLNLVSDFGDIENYSFSIDIRNSYAWSQTPVAGIRLADPADETNYYELALLTPQEPNDYVYQQYSGALAGCLPPRFTKVVGGTKSTAAIKANTEIPEQWAATAYSENNAVTILHQQDDYEMKTTYFTVTMTKIGDTVCWSVYDKVRDLTVWEASYSDEEALFDNIGLPQIFVYGNGADNVVFFDNAKLTAVDADTFEIPDEATLVLPEETPEPEPEPEEPVVSTDATPDTPLYLLRDEIEGHPVYTPVGTKAEDINNNVPSYATGFGGNVSDVMVDGYWATSALLGGTEWFNDYCVQYDELTGNGWSGNGKAPIGYLNSTPDESNKVIALQPAYNEKGQLCVLNLTKNLGDAKDFIYSVDVRNFFSGTVNPVAGIRLADPTDDTSYYELALISKGEVYDVDHEAAKFEKPRFTKVESGNTHTAAVASSGNEPTEWKYVDYGNTGTASAMYKNDGYRTTWFTLTLAKKGNTIHWSIVDKAFNEVVWEDSFTDESPLFESMGKLQLFAYGAGKCQLPTFFDNIDVKKLGTKLFKYEEIADTFADTIESVSGWTVSGGATFSLTKDKKLANNWGGGAEYDLDDSIIQLNANGALSLIDYTAKTADSYSVDLRNYLYGGETSPVMGVRIADPDNSQNYYELAIISPTTYVATAQDAAVSAPRFTKVIGGTVSTPAVSDIAPAEVTYIEKGSEKTASGSYIQDSKGGYATNWFNLEISKNGNDITFAVTDKETGSTIWSKTWTDDEVLFENAGKLQVFTYGGNAPVFINNVSGVIMGDSGLRIEASWVKNSGGAPFMATADYDSDGRLVNFVPVEAPKGTKGYYFSPSSLSMAGALKKLFVWDKATFEPLTEVAQYQEGDIGKCVVTFPNYSTKAFTVSLDDGNSSYDPAVMAIMKKYGIKGTFNLTGSIWTNYSDYDYPDFEVANHTTHIEMYNGSYTYDDCVASIDEGYNLIKEKTGGVECEGVIWPYRAPKNLSFWSQLYDYVSSKYEYARETGETYDFSIPLDWMQWSATAWSSNWRTYTDRFMSAEYTDELQLLALAGHAFDEPTGETSMTDLCEYVFSKVASDERIWKATNIEVCKYTKAVKSLEITSKNVYNPDEDVTVYMIIDGNRYVAEPQSYAKPLN